MNEMISIPKVEYERLMQAAEDLEDLEAVKNYLAAPKEGLPLAFMERMIDGESPLSVYRDWRGFNQSSLSKASDVNRVQIADIEAGRSKGSVATLKKLAETLNVSIDDLV